MFHRALTLLRSPEQKYSSLNFKKIQLAKVKKISYNNHDKALLLELHVPVDNGFCFKKSFFVKLKYSNLQRAIQLINLIKTQIQVTNRGYIQYDIIS